MNQISTKEIDTIKAAATAAAQAVKEAAAKGTKLPASQWAKRDTFEQDGTAQLKALLASGYVVASIGKPTTNKAGEVGVNFKIAAPQVDLKTKVTNYVHAQENAAARRKLAREAKQTPAAVPAPVVPMPVANSAAAAIAVLAGTKAA